MSKAPKRLSPGEELFAVHCGYEGMTPEREFLFHPKRRWRFDFAFPFQKIAVEIEGGIWTGGSHTRGERFEGDAHKYNAAVKLGWRVLRYSTRMVKDGTAINDVLELMK